MTDRHDQPDVRDIAFALEWTLGGRPRSRTRQADLEELLRVPRIRERLLLGTSDEVEDVVTQVIEERSQLLSPTDRKRLMVLLDRKRSMDERDQDLARMGRIRTTPARSRRSTLRQAARLLLADDNEAKKLTSRASLEKGYFIAGIAAGIAAIAGLLLTLFLPEDSDVGGRGEATSFFSGSLDDLELTTAFDSPEIWAVPIDSLDSFPAPGSCFSGSEYSQLEEIGARRSTNAVLLILNTTAPSRPLITSIKLRSVERIEEFVGVSSVCGAGAEDFVDIRFDLATSHVGEELLAAGSTPVFVEVLPGESSAIRLVPESSEAGVFHWTLELEVVVGDGSRTLAVDFEGKPIETAIPIAAADG